MSYLTFMLAVILLSTFVFVGGMAAINRDTENNPYGFRSSLKDYAGWGAGFFVAFATEFSILAYL